MLKYNDDDKNWKLEFDFRRRTADDTGELVDFSGLEPLGAVPQVRRPRLRTRQQLRV